MTQELFTAVLIDIAGNIRYSAFGKMRFELQGLFASWAFTIADEDHIEVASEKGEK
jgi:hypothetical protein